MSVVDSSVGRVFSFSHKGPCFKCRHGHLFVLLVICDQLIVKLMSINGRSIKRRLLIYAGAHRLDIQNFERYHLCGERPSKNYIILKNQF
jgi:hypothetical protein